MTSIDDVSRTESTMRAGALAFEGAGAFTFLAGSLYAIYNRNPQYLVKGLAAGVMFAGAGLVTTAAADIQESPLTEDNKINSAGYIVLGSGAIIGALPFFASLETLPDMNSTPVLIMEGISAILCAAGTGAIVYRITKK
jgi:hypothetical protein